MPTPQEDREERNSRQANELLIRLMRENRLQRGGSRRRNVQQHGTQQQSTQQQDALRQGAHEQDHQEHASQDQDTQTQGIGNKAMQDQGTSLQSDQQERTQEKATETPSFVWVVDEIWLENRSDLGKASHRLLHVFPTSEAAQKYAERFVGKLRRLTSKDFTRTSVDSVYDVETESEKRHFGGFAVPLLRIESFDEGGEDGEVTWIVDWQHRTIVSVWREVLWTSGEELVVAEPMWQPYMPWSRDETLVDEKHGM